MADMTENSEQWERLGRVLSARLDELDIQEAEVEEAGGPKPTKLRELRNGRARTLRRSLKLGLERAVRWQGGSVDAVLSGGDPTPFTSEAERFISTVRHPSNRDRVVIALDGPGGLDAALERAVTTGQLDNESRELLAQLRDDRMIEGFPAVFDSLTRTGQLRVAHFGQQVRSEEREGVPPPPFVGDPATEVQRGPKESDVSATDDAGA